MGRHKAQGRHRSLDGTSIFESCSAVSAGSIYYLFLECSSFWCYVRRRLLGSWLSYRTPTSQLWMICTKRLVVVLVARDDTRPCWCAWLVFLPCVPGGCDWAMEGRRCVLGSEAGWSTPAYRVCQSIARCVV